LSISLGSKEQKIVPPENKAVKGHWPKVVMHQGWLLKKGGMGVGSAKSWIKRYFVLYKTSQGHFLVYYSDFTECPLFSTDRGYRNVIDLAKCTFIRPGSLKADYSDTPPNSFDIVTTEREWTLCAESQENVQKWLIVLTRAVDEDVAILPDEELIFKVKPKVDPLGLMPATDYSTTLRISAHGISVCIPDINSKGNSLSSTPERELFFWVYTDFYKWSLLSQNGKLALLVNVFADSSFSRRNEFIFRNKEAARLATSIEFFIEKFMCVMHIRLENVEGIFDVVQAQPVIEETHGMHTLPVEEVVRDDEVNLLDLDLTSIALEDSNQDSSRQIYVEPSIQNYTQNINQDPFSSDPFGTAFEQTIQKIAPGLSQAQQQLHNKYFVDLLNKFNGNFYDDGSLLISLSVEVRGSQGRITFNYKNQGSSTISNFKLSIEDNSTLSRFELGPCQTSFEPFGSGYSQQLMLECMKPVISGPFANISYHDSLVGTRNNTLQLPILVNTFNDPLTLTGLDFTTRWDSLSAPGLQSQEVFYPQVKVVPSEISMKLNNVSFISTYVSTLYTCLCTCMC
jgi:hypothetical protein